MTHKEVKVPKYQFIENDLVEKITRGTYSPGEAIPSEAELVELYNCSRVTVRQALSNLAYKGFIYKKQGSGAYVKEAKTIQSTPLLKSFTTDMEEQGKHAFSKVNIFTITEADKQIAAILKIQEKEMIYHIERTRYADKDAIVYEDTYMAVALHPNISVGVLQGSKFKYAETNGFDLAYGFQHITPSFPSETIADELKISPKQPLIKVFNTVYLTNGDVFDYTIRYLHPELYQLNMVKYR